MGKKACICTKWFPDGFQDPFSTKGAWILDNFGVPFGAPKSPQNATLAENGVTRIGCLSIFVLFPLFSAFYLDLSPIFDEKSTFFSLFFSMPSRLFCKLATLTIVRILQVQTRFSIFQLCKKTENLFKKSVKNLNPEK